MSSTKNVCVSMTVMFVVMACMLAGSVLASSVEDGLEANWPPNMSAEGAISYWKLDEMSLADNVVALWLMNDDAASTTVINEVGTNGTCSSGNTSGRTKTSLHNDALEFDGAYSDATTGGEDDILADITYDDFGFDVVLSLMTRWMDLWPDWMFSDEYGDSY